MNDDMTPPNSDTEPDDATTGRVQTRADVLAMITAAGLTLADLQPRTGHARLDTTLRAYLPKELTKLQRDLPNSVATWGPYLQMLCDGLPETCPCPCPACSVGPCPCGTHSQHAGTCSPPKDLTYSCADRYVGVGDKDVAEISEDDVRDLAWWARRRALQRTVRRNVNRALTRKPPLLSDGRGAAQSAIQACRWLLGCFQRNRGLPGVTDNVAAAVKLPTSQERPARSLDYTELLEVYRVVVTTGRDPELDGLLLRHQLIQGVRRSGLLDATAGGLDAEAATCTYWDQKRQTYRTRPSTADHIATLFAHIVERGPRIAAPPDAPDEVRRTGLLNIADSDPVFYGRPTDVLDAVGFLLQRTTHPVTRKHIEVMYARIQRHLPWAKQRGLRPHDMRHSSARLIYKESGDEQMARLHLGHDATSSTDHYLTAQLAALAALKEMLFSQSALDSTAEDASEE